MKVGTQTESRQRDACLIGFIESGITLWKVVAVVTTMMVVVE